MDQRPNVLLITTDQQRRDSLGCYHFKTGKSFIHTPNIDRIAEEGALCERAYCTNPVCTPARASIFSGLQVSRHGAWNVGMSVPQDVPLLSHMLSSQGYHTHYIGKAHFQSFLGEIDQSWELVQKGQERYAEFHGPYYGFETVELAPGHVNYGLKGHYGDWVRSQVSESEFQSYEELQPAGKTIFGGEAYDWNLPLALHNSNWTAQRTISFLERQKPGEPFFLAVGFQDPHHPHGLPVEFKERLKPEDVPLPGYIEGELADKPPFFLEARQGGLESSSIRGEFEVAGQGAGYDYRLVPEGDARLGRAYYFSMVKLIDQAMGKILEFLDSNGMGENTLLIFTTDHGELLGDHGLWMKGPFHYEELVRIPMLWRWPAGLPGGMRIQGLISQVDIVPSVLGALGIHRPGLDGVNALPLFRDESSSIRDSVLIETVDDPAHLRMKTIVTHNRKLTFYHGKEYGELYNLEQDRQELSNLWDTPEYKDEKLALVADLLDYSEAAESARRATRHAYA